LIALALIAGIAPATADYYSDQAARLDAFTATMQSEITAEPAPAPLPAYQPPEPDNRYRIAPITGPGIAIDEDGAGFIGQNFVTCRRGLNGGMVCQ
jgi:hypothetical protein